MRAYQFFKNIQGEQNDDQVEKPSPLTFTDYLSFELYILVIFVVFILYFCIPRKKDTSAKSIFYINNFFYKATVEKFDISQDQVVPNGC